VALAGWEVSNWWATDSRIVVSRVPCDDKTDRRMYSAGYREGQRLAHVGPLSRHTDTMVTTDEHLIKLGANAYAHGFADGWRGLVPDWSPLLLSDTDNHFLGARSPEGTR